MNIKIHRGLEQVGGCITEISTENSRVFIDMGQNLPGNGEQTTPEQDKEMVEDIFRNNPKARGSQCAAYEFKQEGENDHEFLRLFSTWLHEYPQIGGHTEYYLLMGMRQGEHLTDEEFEFLERNVAECFASSHGWYYEINHRMRFRLNITLIISQHKEFRRLIKKELP